MKQLLLFMLCPLLMFGQTQIGQDIDGEAFNDFSGSSISLSSDGSIVAIGAPQSDTGLGYVRVYENQSGTWLQIGQDIDGEAFQDESGGSVSLSSDGSIVAIGASKNNSDDSGHVRVYENQSGTWIQIGQDIEGDGFLDSSGSSVSLSSDGSIVAIGAPQFTIDAGVVRVYKNQSGTWIQIGQDLDGEAFNDWSGESVSLSSDGTIVAIGAGLNDGNSDRSGHVRIYENQSGTWVQIGQDIDGEATVDLSGSSVSLSSDGTIVAIGATGNDENGSNSGHVRVFENQSGTWVQIGQDINGETAGDGSGSSVSLSSAGTIVAIGAYGNDGNIDGSGQVRVYDLSAVLSTESFNVDYFSYYPNPVKDVLNLNLNPDLVLKQVNIYNNLGQYLYSTKSIAINTSNLASGFYFIEVETDQGKSSKKIIVE